MDIQTILVVAVVVVVAAFLGLVWRGFRMVEKDDHWFHS